MATDKQILNWLNAQVRANKLRQKELDLGNFHTLADWSYRAGEGVHCGAENIRTVAKRLGFTLQKEPWESQQSDIDTVIFFIYQDVKFFGLESPEEYAERGEI